MYNEINDKMSKLTTHRLRCAISWFVCLVIVRWQLFTVARQAAAAAFRPPPSAQRKKRNNHHKITGIFSHQFLTSIPITQITVENANLRTRDYCGYRSSSMWHTQVSAISCPHVNRQRAPATKRLREATRPAYSAWPWWQAGAILLGLIESSWYCY